MGQEGERGESRVEGGGGDRNTEFERPDQQESREGGGEYEDGVEREKRRLP